MTFFNIYLIFVCVTTQEKLFVYHSWCLLLFKGLPNIELEDLDLRGKNVQILDCQKIEDKTVLNLSCACFSVFGLLQSFASFTFLFI